MSNKKLYRSRKQRVLGGVCGGLAEFFDIDVTIIRLVWAVSFFMGGVGLLLYILAAIVIPNQENTQRTVIIDENGNETYVSEDANSGYGSNTSNSMLFLGGILIVIGGLVLLEKVFPFRWLWNEIKDFGWPVLLILAGALILATSFRKKD